MKTNDNINNYMYILFILLNYTLKNNKMMANTMTMK